MSFEEYLREKAAESRQKESIGFSLIVLGMVLLVGGFLITLIVIGNPDWFLFIIPWKRTSDPTSLISLSMTLSGFVLAFAGSTYVIFASADRSWYLNSLKDTLERTPKEEEEIFKHRLQDLKRKIENLRDSAEKG